jgi:uncharacterized protein
MRLYAGTSQQFITDNIHNQISEKLKNAFFSYYRFNPSPAEINSWRNSLRSISQVFQYSNLMDQGVLLEYQLPLTSKRLDCMITGKDDDDQDNAVIVELKQWDSCEEADGENEVQTWLGGVKRDVLHPAAQVGQYATYLKDTHTAFYEDRPILLNACTYLHNYSFGEEDVLLADKFKPLTDKFPVFSEDDVDSLREYLIKKLKEGHGIDVLRRVEQGKYRPSKKLMDHVANVIKGVPQYILLDEQLVAYDKVFASARKGFQGKKKTVIIIKGGPGTGKSVIAINLMADLLLEEYNAQYATGSRAFTETLRNIIGARGAIQFKYFNSYMNAEVNDVDVIICDEAHRIRKTSNDRFTRREHQSFKPQIKEIIDTAKVSVFLIDDNQVVRPDEIGSVGYIRENAKKENCNLYEYELEAQFRCSGSDAFVNWINNTLGIQKTANVLWSGEEEFDFRIFDSPQSLELAIKNKVNEGFTARMTAGFCWEWSKNPESDGTLKNDIDIDGYVRPWNARPEAKRLARNIPKATLWAYDPNGINQVGCVYTAQGFEFDYVGVIFGTDLVYNFDKQTWEGHRENSHDNVVRRSREKFIDLLKNTYRILLSRGLKGCYVYFIDKDTEKFIKSRIEIPAVVASEQIKEIISPKQKIVEYIPFRRLSPEEVKPFINCVPMYDLKIAASGFSETQQVEHLEWVELSEDFKPNKELFIAQVIGQSMNRRIPNGAWCLFRRNPSGTRQGKVVLVQHRDIHDPETGGHYTIKVYKSEKTLDENGGWEHTKIILSPDSSIPGFEPIEFTPDQTGELMVIAELVAVLS